MTHRSPQPSPDPVEHPAPAGRPGSRTTTGTKVVVAVLCALLGFGVALQFRRTASGDALASVRPDDLVQILDGLQRREDDLTEEIGALTDTLSRLRTAGDSSAEALAEAQRRAEALGILTGTAAASGSGVRITVTDPAGTVPPEVLLDAIQELRNAGAEAFAVDDARIGMQSEFTGVAGAIRVDGIAIGSPYVVLAIGDGPTLSAALSIPGGVVDTVRRAGATIDIEQSKAIRIDVLRPSHAPSYARPAG
jgi:uncharacterized protein YlxW (UPF0749 family)